MLPDLTNLNAFEALMAHVDTINTVETIRLKRRLQGEPIKSRLLPDEAIWIAQIGLTGGLVRMALEELDPKDVIELWMKKTKHKPGAGRPPEAIYSIAQGLAQIYDKPDMEIYYEYVLPILVSCGRIQVDEHGEPDPYQDVQERKNYLKALARLRKTPRNYAKRG
jgi:hypothetical protein